MPGAEMPGAEMSKLRFVRVAIHCFPFAQTAQVKARHSSQTCHHSWPHDHASWRYLPAPSTQTPIKIRGGTRVAEGKSTWLA